MQNNARRPTLSVVAFSGISRFMRRVPRFVLRSVAFPDGTDFNDRESALMGLAYSQGLYGPAPAWIEDVAMGTVESFNTDEA